MATTITARYAKGADTNFAHACSLDQIHRGMRSLIDFHGMPRGLLLQGQGYGFTPVLWTWVRLPEVRLTCSRIDPVARVEESHETPSGDSRITITITPDGAGCIWADKIEQRGIAPNAIAGWITRRIHRATHRRLRALAITISFEPT